MIELLVVVAIIALLISLLLPGLAGAREQAKRAYCLSNLRGIGTASNAYASEDKREQVVPIQITQTRLEPSTGWNSLWWWRTASPFAFGGRAATVPFPVGTTNVRALMDATPENPVPPAGAQPQWWGVQTRPLNRYVFGSVDSSDKKKAELYHCPSDDGFADNLPQSWMTPAERGDFPISAAKIPLYDLVGNSYRINVCGAVQNLSATPQFSVSVAPWGHRLSSLQSTGRLVMYCEPMFYVLSRQGPADLPNGLGLTGWHRVRLTDQVGMVDGSARAARGIQLANWTNQLLNQMNYIDPNGGLDWRFYLRRGQSWQTDCYPTPAAWMPRRMGTGNFITPVQALGAAVMRKWPHAGIQQNVTD